MKSNKKKRTPIILIDKGFCSSGFKQYKLKHKSTKEINYNTIKELKLYINKENIRPSLPQDFLTSIEGIIEVIIEEMEELQRWMRLAVLSKGQELYVAEFIAKDQAKDQANSKASLYTYERIYAPKVKESTENLMIQGVLPDVPESLFAKFEAYNQTDSSSSSYQFITTKNSDGQRIEKIMGLKNPIPLSEDQESFFTDSIYKQTDSNSSYSYECTSDGQVINICKTNPDNWEDELPLKPFLHRLYDLLLNRYDEIYRNFNEYTRKKEGREKEKKEKKRSQASKKGAETKRNKELDLEEKKKDTVLKDPFKNLTLK